jgi:hypothetical protein
MIADRPRLRTMLGSLARTLHVGPLADCFFDPATALCLNRISEPGPPGANDRHVRAGPLPQCLHRRTASPGMAARG